MKQKQSGPQFTGQTAPSQKGRAGGESIDNSRECFVELWLRLEHTRRLLWVQHKRFCIRNILKAWFGLRATNDFIWEVCTKCEQMGWNELPTPMLYPRKHREFLRAIVAVRLGISFYRVNLKALDAAYSVAFPNSTEININKKKKDPLPTSPSKGRRDFINHKTIINN